MIPSSSMANLNGKKNFLGESRNDKTLNALTSDSMSGGDSPTSKNRNVIIMKNNRSKKSMDNQKVKGSKDFALETMKEEENQSLNLGTPDDKEQLKSFSS